MAEPETTMADLLGNLKRIIALETAPGSSLDAIKLVKRGVLPPRMQYPVLTLVPASERIETYGSSGQVKVRRTVDVYLFGSPQSPDALWTLQDTMDQVQELLRENRQVPDVTNAITAIDCALGPINMDPDTVGLHFQAGYLSREALPQVTIDPTPHDNPSPRELRDAIHAYLSGLKPTALAGIRSFWRESWDQATRATFPAVVVSLDDHQSDEQISGMETITAEFAVDLYSLVLGASDDTLVTHLGLVQAMKIALLSQPTWSSMALRTHIRGIEYGSLVDDENALYQSTCYLTVVGRRMQ